MVPHIGSEESAGLAGSGGDWGVCVDAPVVVGRCAVGPPPLRRFFCAEDVAKMPPVGPRLGVWGGKSNGAPDRNPGKEETDPHPVQAFLVSMEPQIGIRGRGRCGTAEDEGDRVSMEPQIGIRGRISATPLSDDSLLVSMELQIGIRGRGK